MKRNKKKLNNKGFSLVELIVVIAIMAILVGVMAPQVMKYIGKSRTSVDTTNSDAIKSAVQTALADEAVNEAVASSIAAITGTDKKLVFNITNGVCGLADGTFKTELTSIIGKYPTVKQSSYNSFKVTIDENMNVTVTLEKVS